MTTPVKKFLPALKAATALLVSFAFLAGSATVLNVIESAEAAPGPFTCTSNFYQVSNGDMYQYSVTNNTYTKMAQSTNVAALNAAGYNTADNYIYAITSTGNGAGKSTTLYKFANDGSHTSLGVLSGGGASIAAGDFIAPNELLTVNGTGHTPLGTFTLIDTNTATTDPNRLSVSAFTSTGSTWAADDFAYNPSTNTIYGIDGTTLYVGTITGSTVAVTTKPVANSGNSTATDAWGATYIDSAGNAYFFDNNNFNLVEISAASLASSTPSALNITQANTLASPNDGASCPTASSPLAPTVVTTTATAVTTTTATLNGTVATGIPASSNITSGNIVMCYSTSNTVVNGALSVSPVCAATTPSTLSANTAATAVALPVSGLAPGTTYYYQLEATNAYGLEGFGAVNNFVTTAATHTVTFAANGGTGTMANETNNAATALTTNTFTRAGYTFAGWVATPGSVAYTDGQTYSFTADATMTAQWTAIPDSTVTFAANGGTGTMAPESNNVPTALTTNTFSRPGYTFAGWVATPGSISYTDGQTYAFSSDATMTAQWTAIPLSTVTFVANGGAGTMAPESNNVPAALTTNTFTRAGFTFAGWIASPGGATYGDAQTYAFSSDATMTAQWTAIPNSTVTFVANGGTGTMAPEVQNVPTALTANTFTRPGYTFAGWVATPGSVAYTDGQTYAFSSNATMTAQWTAIPNSTVTFAANGGSGTMAPESDNIPTALTTNAFTRPGYTFAGWVATPGSTAYADGDSYAFDADATMTAQWTAIPVSTVTFVANGGSGSMAPESDNVPTALTTNAFTRPGYTFAGWVATPGSTPYTDGDSYAFDADATMTAQWTAIPNSTVTFAANGGTGTMAPESDNVPTALATNTFTRAGYTFAGWVATPGSTPYADGDSYAFDADATMTAQWTAIPNSTVTFAANGGTGTMAPEVNNVPTALTANTFTRAGYTFAGWVATPGGTPYADGDSYAFGSSTTMTAQWTPIGSKSVTFNANGGTGSMAIEINNVPAALTTNTIVRPGFTFAGWATSANGPIVYVDGATDPFSANEQLYAQWTAIAVLSFDPNGGTGSVASISANGPTVLPTTTVSRPGYLFKGWNTAEDGSGTEYAAGSLYPLTASGVLFAQFTKILAYTGVDTASTMNLGLLLLGLGVGFVAVAIATRRRPRGQHRAVA